MRVKKLSENRIMIQPYDNGTEYVLDERKARLLSELIVSVLHAKPLPEKGIICDKCGYNQLTCPACGDEIVPRW